MQPNRRPLWLLLVLLGVFAVLLVVLLQFREALNQGVVGRLAQMLWYASMLFNSVDQQLYFTVLLVIVAVTAFGILLGLYLRAGASGGENRPGESRPVSRARHWTELIYVRAPIQYTRELMNNEVRRLLLDHFGLEGEVEREQVEQMIAAGELDVPPEVVPYLSKRRFDWLRTERQDLTPVGRMQKLTGRLRKTRITDTPREPMDPQLERVVAYLEKQLEVSDDTGG